MILSADPEGRVRYNARIGGFSVWGPLEAGPTVSPTSQVPRWAGHPGHSPLSGRHAAVVS